MEHQGIEQVDYLTLPDHLEQSPSSSTFPLIRFDGLDGEYIDTTLSHGFYMQGSGLVEWGNYSDLFGQDVFIYFNVKNTSEQFKYMLSFKDLYVDGITIDDDDYYHQNLHSKYYIGNTLKPGEDTQLLLKITESSMLRKDRFSPFPQFNHYIYGKLLVVVQTVGVAIGEDKNFATFYVPFTMPLF